jgi:hypothetical protein
MSRHVALIEEFRNAYTSLVGNLNGRSQPKDPSVMGRIILEWILVKQGGKMCTACVWLRMGPVTGCCDYGNEPSGSIKGVVFLD